MNERDRAGILVPLDGSAFGESALPTGLALAQSLGGTLHLLSVDDLSESLLTAGVDAVSLGAPRASIRLEEYLRETAERMGDRAGVPITCSVVGDGVTRSIERYIEHAAPRFVVMSTHGRGPFQRAWLGSVADRVVRHVHVPVLLVRPREGERRDLVTPVGFHEILVPLDGSWMSERILDHVACLARAFGAHVRLLRVVPHPVPHVVPFLREALMSAAEVTARFSAEPKSYLERVAEPLRREGMQVDVDVLVDEEPTAGILAGATAATADLIALATHGLGGVCRFVLGSVADKVIRAAHVPVLTLRPAGVPA